MLDSEFTETAHSGESTEVDLRDNEPTCWKPLHPEDKYIPPDVFPFSCDSSLTPFQREGLFSGVAGRTTEVVLLPGPLDQTIYVNPVPGTINIRLGNAGQCWTEGATVTIKDVTLQFAPTSKYNVNIFPSSSEVMIETYMRGALRAVRDMGYAINSDGGAVTFRFNGPLDRELPPCWTVQNQFIGNVRSVGEQTVVMPVRW